MGEGPYIAFLKVVSGTPETRISPLVQRKGSKLPTAALCCPSSEGDNLYKHGGIFMPGATLSGLVRCVL